MMTRVFRIFFLLFVSTLLMVQAGDRCLPSTPNRRFAPLIRCGSGKTLNWAGYVAETHLKNPRSHSVTDVQGTWQVPTLVSSGTLDTSSAIWVGIDGVSDQTVEQIGTEQDWTGGAPVYYAWFEMYPTRGYYLSTFPVEPGDQISAEVQVVGKNLFALSISNLTQNAGFSITKKRSAKCSSADWIVEAPYLHRILTLADFGLVTFTDCSATIEGVQGPINDISWQNQAEIMEARKTASVLAQPSALTTNATGFTVTWEQN